MSEDGFTIEAADKERIYIYRWLPDLMKPLRCIIQIAHGMAEHAGRYRAFAKYLNSIGIGVYANDHRGHGKTAGQIENVGYFADKNGWELVVNDMFQLTDRIRDKHEGIPVFLLGHSMGSFLARDYISRSESDLSGVILSGTAGDPGIMGSIGIFTAKFSCRFKGRRTPDKLLDKLSFGSFNKKFEPARTKFDWLSRDEQIVDNYIEDEFCGGVFSSGFFLDLFQGIKKINNRNNINSISSDLPIFFMSGEKDPVGAESKGVKKVIKEFKKAGLQDIEYKFFDNGRHEMLNELNRSEVFEVISEWIGKKLEKE